MSRCLLLLIAFVPLAHAQSPRLAWSAFLDKGIEDVVQVVVPDPDGGIWVAGHSGSNYIADGPNVPFQAARKGDLDIFIAKYRAEPDGSTTLLFWTWFGGGGRETLSAMRRGDDGKLYLTGTTNSLDFPLGGQAFQTAIGGATDAFIAVIDPSQEGDATIFFSTYWGGTGDETPAAIAIAPDGTIVIAGQTNSVDLPNVQGANRVQESNRGGIEAFILRCDFGGVQYATYFGGRLTDGATGVVVDKDNNIWFTGWTASDDFPATEGSIQDHISIHFDAFVAKINSNVAGLDGLIYCTFYGGSGTDVAYSMALDDHGALWVGGYTTSSDFVTSPNAFQRSFSGYTDAFVFRMIIDAPQPAIVYSTYYGGLGHEVLRSLAPAPGGRVALTGYTMYGDLPVTSDALQALPLSAFADGFIAILDSTVEGREGLLYSSYVGGEATDIPLSVAYDANNAIVLSGYTNSYGFPVTDGSFRTNPPLLPSGMVQRIVRE